MNFLTYLRVYLYCLMVSFSALTVASQPVLEIQEDFTQADLADVVFTLRSGENQQLSVIQELDDWQLQDSIRPLREQSSLWARIILSNSTENTQDMRILLANPSFQQADWYVVDDRNRIRRSVAMGSQVQDFQRYLVADQLALPLQIQAGETLKVYLRIVDDGPLILPMRLVSAQQFGEEEWQNQLTLALLGGGLLMLALFFLGSYILLRSRARFWLTMAILSSVLLFGHLQGVLYQIFALPNLSSVLTTVFLALMLVTLAKVSHFILQPVPRYWRSTTYVTCALLLVGAFVLEPYWQLVFSTSMTAAILVLQLFLCAWLTHGPRRTPNRLLALGWAAIAVAGSLEGSLYLYGVPPARTLHFVLLMLAASGILSISLALSAFEQALHLNQLRLQSGAIDELRQFYNRFQGAEEGMYSATLDGRLLSINPAVSELFGYESTQQMMAEVKDTADLYADKKEREILLHSLRHNGIVLGSEVQVRRRDGSLVWLAMSAQLKKDKDQEYMVGSLVDISTRKFTSPDLAYLSNHDGLTGLFNRREFERRLQFAFDTARQQQSKLSLVYINIRGFRLINEACGNKAGDVLLQHFAQLLHESSPARGTLARLGADRFCLALEKDLANATEQIASSIEQRIQAFRFNWENAVFDIHVTIGLAELSVDQSSFNELLSAARIACEAVSQHGSPIHWYQTQDGQLETLQTEINWHQLIQRGLAQNQFRLYYQLLHPLKAVSAGHRYELLLRFNPEDSEPVYPRTFLPVAGRHNLLATLDLWVIENYLQWLSRNQEHNSELQFVSINLSSNSLVEKAFVNQLLALFEQYQLDYSVFCFEINESDAIVHQQECIEFISTFSRFGCRFALDDFGGALNSHGMLDVLPINYLKIHPDLVRTVNKSVVSEALVSAIVRIAQHLQIDTIAEAVEDSQTLVALGKMGVDYAQGYGIVKPKPLLEFRSL